MLRQISHPVTLLPAVRLPNAQKPAPAAGQRNAASAMTSDKFYLRFSGKKEKGTKTSNPPAAEIAELKRKESMAPQIRATLPAILKWWSPLPQKNNANIKYGNITKFLSDLESSPIASRSATLLEKVRALIEHPKPNELHLSEEAFFNVLSDTRKTMTKDTLASSAFLNALQPGPLRDACIAYILQQDKLGNIRQATAKEVHSVSNPAMRASLQAMVRHAQGFADSRQESQGGHMELPNPLLQHLMDYSYDPKVRTALAKLYYYPYRPSLPDEHKRRIILSLMEDKDVSEHYFSAVPILAALGAFHDPKKKAECIEELQKNPSYLLPEGLKLATRIQTPDKIAQLDQEMALPSLAQEGLKPFIDRGFSLLDAPKLTSLLEKTGRDASALITTILPEYDEVMEFAIKHPDRFVKTGSKPLSEDEIRAHFHKQGALILQALILTGGTSTLKNTIHRKRLDNLLQMMPAVMRCPDLIKPAYQLSKMTAESVDVYKLVEFMAGFSEMQKENELKILMDKMVQNKKLDIKAIGKAYLTSVFANSVLKDVQIDEDQVDNWDVKYMSTLASALRGWRGTEREELLAVCKAALQGRMHSFLHDPATQVGQNNLATQKAFETAFKKEEGLKKHGKPSQEKELKLDYEQWLNYPGEVTFKHLAKADEQQAITQALNDFLLEIQRKHPALWPDIEGDLSLYQFPMSHGQLHSLFEHPADEKGLQEILQQETLFKEPELQKKADYLSWRIGNLRYAPPQTQQLKIKLWDRNPGTDLFLGNYAGACIALDSHGGRSYTSVQANQNTFVQVAYLRDESDRVVGLGLFYWAKNTKTGEPILILNTFEGRARGSGYENNMQVRDKYVEFAKQYSRAVLGYAAPLYTGTQYNPLYRDDLDDSPVEMQVVGRALHNRFYLDSLPDDGGKVDAHHQPNHELELLDAGEPLPET